MEKLVYLSSKCDWLINDLGKYRSNRNRIEAELNRRVNQRLDNLQISTGFERSNHIIIIHPICRMISAYSHYVAFIS